MKKYLLKFCLSFYLLAGADHISAQITPWFLSGNAGTTDGTNFIGTTDNRPLNFRVNNTVAGRIDPTLLNTFFGLQAGGAVNTGNNNTAIGYSSLSSNTTGNGNLALGIYALQNNTSGSYNAALGFGALSSNTIGNGNFANGTYALRFNTSGIYNTASGYAALYNNTTGNYNIATGYAALLSNTTGSYNTATGWAALYSNTTGTGNLAYGYAALRYNTTGSYNTANGYAALTQNYSGGFNSAYGYNALTNNVGGTQNTANGYQALLTNTYGNGNTAVGYSADVASANLSNATAIGSGAIVNASNTIQLGNSSVTRVLTGTGSNAILVAGGLQITGGSLAAGKILTSDASGVATWQNAAPSGWSLNGNAGTADGTNFIGTTDNRPFNIRVNNSPSGRIDQTLKNAFYGYQSGSSNTTGYYNVSNGYQALYSNTTGYYNTAEGGSALASNLSGNFNTAIGNGALLYNTTGAHNAANGYAALAANMTGNYNTAIGDYANVNADGITNSTALGSQALNTASNQVRIGNSSVTSIGGYTNWTNISDGRVKKNIKQNVPGLAFINKLSPVTYNLDLEAADQIIKGSVSKNMNNGVIQPAIVESAARLAKEAVVYTGFVAQDVEKAAKSLNYNFSGVDAPKSSSDLYGLRYSDFVVPLVKAVQELSTKNDSLQNQNKLQQEQIKSLKNATANQQQVNNDLQQQLNDLRALVLSIQQCSPCNLANTKERIYNTIITDGGSLEQNVPNPFDKTTTIRYTLPQEFSSAQIVITDKNGTTLKVVTVSGSGKGSLVVDTQVLAAGAYNYSLIVDGRLIGTKQMILAR